MTKASPKQLKGTSLKIIQTLLRGTDSQTLHASLAELMGNSPDSFENDLVVLEFTAADNFPAGVDWQALCGLLRGSGFQAVATRFAVGLGGPGFGCPGDLARRRPRAFGSGAGA